MVKRHKLKKQSRKQSRKQYRKRSRKVGGAEPKQKRRRIDPSEELAAAELAAADLSMREAQQQLDEVNAGLQRQAVPTTAQQMIGSPSLSSGLIGMNSEEMRDRARILREAAREAEEAANDVEFYESSPATPLQDEAVEAAMGAVSSLGSSAFEAARVMEPYAATAARSAARAASAGVNAAGNMARSAALRSFESASPYMDRALQGIQGSVASGFLGSRSTPEGRLDMTNQLIGMRDGLTGPREREERRARTRRLSRNARRSIEAREAREANGSRKRRRSRS